MEYKPQTIDHIFKNSIVASEFKSAGFEKAKRDIDAIYESLNVHKITNGNYKRFSNISSFIPFNVKEKFMKNSMHNQLTQNMKNLNDAMIEFQN